MPRQTGNKTETRASDFLDRARQEATTPRLVAAGTLAAGAAAYLVLRDADRRERMWESIQSYVDRGRSWWNGEDVPEAPVIEAAPAT